MNYIAKSFPPLTGIRIEFRDAADNSPALIWMAGEDGLCNWFNRGWLEFTGRTIEQEIGNGWLEGVHSQDLQPCIDQYLKHFNAREHFLLEYRLRRFDGQYRWILDSGTPVFDPEGAFLGYNGVCFDINERKEAENEARIAATVFESQEGMMVTDANRLIIKVNAAFTAITGYSLDDVKGKDPRLLSSGRHDRQFYAAMWKQINATGTWHSEVWNKRKGGEIYPQDLTITAVKDASGIITNYVATLINISERKKLESELTRQAHIDYLTGLLSRRRFMEQGEVELARAIRYDKPLSILMLDIDFFKKVNDTYGHQVGDAVLQALSKACQNTLRQVDIAGRLGGEEFGVILPETTDKEAHDVAERLREVIANTEVTIPVGLPIHLNVSIGVTTMKNKNTNIDVLLNQADKALYEAKQTGRNKVCVG
jgi:diguanylate cyclase (GGDEF)-like protein/PAS domain S-box-containing protein